MYGFVTVPEFSMLMGISADTVYRLVKNDAIPYYRVGRNIRIRIDDFRKGRIGKIALETEPILKAKPEKKDVE